MTAILGISAYYHDAAAALLVDGQIVAAAQEERFTRRKHDPRFPTEAVAYCLAQANLTPEQLDYVGFYEKPLLKFDRLLETYLAFAPRGYRSFAKAMPEWLRTKLHLRREIRKALKGYRRRIVFCEHHESHAASAFFPSPFDRAAVLTLDGVGEWTTTSWGVGEGNRLRLEQEIRFPHSLGLLYSAFTYFCGFRVNSGEYKLMGLAPYGKPRYADLIRTHLIHLEEDGSYRLDLQYFNYCQGLTMTSSRFDRLFGAAPRQPDTPIRPLDMDLAASIQQVSEEVVLRIARHVHRRSGLEDLCMAGGVALNCVANGRLLREGPFRRIWIQPAAGDAGGALGVAMLLWHQLLDRPRNPSTPDSQQGSRLGPAFDDAQVRQALGQCGAVFEYVPEEAILLDRVARYLAEGRVVGWMQGPLEFGPRALGSRSILGDPRSASMQSTMNRKIKFRESFRPFAPAVLADRAGDYFEMPPGADSPYMLVTFDVHPDRRVAPEEGDAHGLEQVHQRRSCVPAITHVDYSARVQTVDAHRNPRFYRLIKRFAEQTGCPLLINTSFNVRGEPIVCTPEDALRCFLATNMDILVVGNHLLEKDKQPAAAEHAIDEHLAQFLPD